MEATETQTKICARCGRTLSVAMFNKSSRSLDGLQSYCRDCQKEKSQERRAEGENPKKMPERCDPALAGFTPRQLINELRARGYRGEIFYTYKITL